MQSVVGLLALLLVSASLAQSPLEDCVKNFDANKDCFTYKSKVDASTLFTVEYNNYYKVLRTTSSAGPQSTYVLVIRGAPNPPISSSANATIQIPIADVAVLDTTVVTMVEVIRGSYFLF
ncbi:hypothetical protein BKA69DRAFT_424500 [Paraphysoderma sedebokerense]|nr:hypothetical protein BKA69DRAFT_424500 [Paraphysoderma sedebokerense]